MAVLGAALLLCIVVSAAACGKKGDFFYYLTLHGDSVTVEQVGGFESYVREK